MDRFDDLNLEDVIQGDLELKKQKFNPETFYIYYVTTEGDILGNLTQYDDFIAYKPVSLAMCGFYDYSSYSLTKNKKLEFRIDYRDIIGPAMKIPLPSSHPSKKKGGELPMNYVVQLELINSGYATHFDDETKELCDHLRKRNEGICTVGIKIRPKSLVGKELTNQEKDELADSLIQQIENKCKLIDHSKEYYQEGEESETIVPFFDIVWRNIFISVKLDFVDENMMLLHKFFGYKDALKSITNIYNQSLYPLGIIFYIIKKAHIFPEIRKGAKGEDSKETNKDKKTGNYYYNPEVVANYEEIMEDTSDIIPGHYASKINVQLPAYQRANMWQLYYSKQRDGKSFKTYFLLF